MEASWKWIYVRAKYEIGNTKLEKRNRKYEKRNAIEKRQLGCRIPHLGASEESAEKRFRVYLAQSSRRPRRVWRSRKPGGLKKKRAAGWLPLFSIRGITHYR
jgi:hypothetical protein